MPGLIDTLGGFGNGGPHLGDIGWQFKVGAEPITLVALRIFHAQAVTGDLRLWKVVEPPVLLATAQVNTVADDWAEAEIDAQTLDADGDYIIVFGFNESDFLYVESDEVTFDPAVTFSHARFNNTIGTFPGMGVGDLNLYGIPDGVTDDGMTLSGISRNEVETVSGYLGWHVEMDHPPVTVKVKNIERVSIKMPKPNLTKGIPT